MEDLPLGRIVALVPEFAVKVLPLGRTLMMMVRKQRELFYFQNSNARGSAQVMSLVSALSQKNKKTH